MFGDNMDTGGDIGEQSGLGAASSISADAEGLLKTFFWGIKS